VGPQADTPYPTICIEGNDGFSLPELLLVVEPTIAITESKQHAWLSEATGHENEYSLTATATDGDELTITRAADGTVSRTCHSPELKTGCSGAENSSW
jgi:hypothetical protein